MIWFSSPGAQPRSAEEVAALDEDFYQRDIAAKYEDLYFDAREQFNVDDVDLGQNKVDARGEFAADNDDAVMDEDDYDDNGAQAGLARKAGLRDMLAKAHRENLNQQFNSDQVLVEKGKKTAYNRPDEASDPPLPRKTMSHPKSWPQVSPLPAPTSKRTMCCSWH